MQAILTQIAIILIVALGGVESSIADTLTVTGFSHPPNYARSSDHGDAQQLTDGRLASSPIWVKKESVGWAATTPVAIELRLIPTGSKQQPRSGTLRLHSAKGLYAGVDVPRHIDVYAKSGDGKLRLVGSSTSQSEKFKDKSGHWLEVAIQAATESLILVLHASGDYVFLDEIEWRPSGMGRPLTSPSSIGNVRSALDDSTRRISGALASAAASEVAAAAQSLPAAALYVWTQDPWRDIELADVPQQMNNPPPALDVRGYAAEHESLCLGIVAGNDVARDGLRVTVAGLAPQTVKLYEVRSVILSSGRLVYDPLVPLDEQGSFTMQSGVPAYLWIDFDLAALGPGRHEFEISLGSGGKVKRFPGAVSISAFSGQGVARLHAVNWAYLSDKPVFHKKAAAVDDLLRHGINTFVAHPAGIPGSSLDGRWPTTVDTNFSDTVELAKRNGMLLLYLGWREEKNPLSISGKTQTLNPAVKERLIAWLNQLSTYLASRGVPLDRWALYPVDEPSRDGLRLIKVVAQAVKEWNPAVQVYADPTVHADPPVAVSDLQEVQDLVDYWQPNLLAVRGHMGEFFRALKKDWWVYGNPKSPAKRASPLHDYRMLAWWAWFYDAKGVGFWSYSDTGGSSAWKDTDGRRPDWAVVYESPQGIVSSRRWEAFREGLEDYVLLSGTSRSDVQRVLPSGEQNFDRWETATVDGVRRALLDVP